jgi:NAD+ synthase
MPGLADDIVTWMQDRVHAAGANGFVVGLSGGVDSAVVARLSQMAMPGAALGALLPCHGDAQDEADARLVAAHFGLPTIRIDLAATYDALAAVVRPGLAQVPPEVAHGGPVDDMRGRLPLANIKPRLRMTVLYFVANSLNYLVAGTGNRCEVAIGYYTKYGDGGVDLLPIARLLKSEVRALARELGVPDRVIDKPPSAGLWLGQTDEGEMGFTYADLERHLTKGPEATAPAVALRIERLIRASEHKRTVPPTPDVA